MSLTRLRIAISLEIPKRSSEIFSRAKPMFGLKEVRPKVLLIIASLLRSDEEVRELLQFSLYHVIFSKCYIIHITINDNFTVMNNNNEQK